MRAFFQFFISITIAVLSLTSEIKAAELPFRSVKNQTEIYYLNPYRPRHTLENHSQILNDWSWLRSESNEATRLLDVPVETGRGVSIPKQYTEKTEVFLKGTGLNSEWAGNNNTIRYATDEGGPVAFDGQFKLVEGLTDITNSEILNELKVPVARPLGMISFKNTPINEKTTGIYAREFLTQTRISNLYAMPLSDAKTEINKAIDILKQHGKLSASADLEAYFFYMISEMSRTAAVFQNTGFWHRVLHYQQFTLAAEVTDLGTGVWLHDLFDKTAFEMPMQSYFAFENQPLLILNMLMRTHALTAAEPIRLGPESDTLSFNKKSLLGIIQSIDPETYNRIIEKDPESFFWSRFMHFTQEIDSAEFQKSFRPSQFYVLENEVDDWLHQIDSEMPFDVFSKNKTLITDLFKKEKARYLPSTFLSQQIPELKKYEIKIRNNAIFRIKSLENLPVAAGFQYPKLKLDEVTKNTKFWKEYSSLGPGYEVPAINNDYFKGTQIKNAPLQESGTIPKKIWGLNIDLNASAVKTWIKEFNNKIRIIQSADPTLSSPESIFRVQNLIAEHSELSYGPKLSSKKQQTLYDEWTKHRYSKQGDARLSDLLTLDAGECQDTALLSYILGLELQKTQPNYRFSIIGSFYGSLENKKHFFVIMNAPNRRSYVIDPIVDSSEATLPLNRAFDPKVIQTHRFYKKLNWVVDAHAAGKPASVITRCGDLLKKLFLLLPLKPGVF